MIDRLKKDGVLVSATVNREIVWQFAGRKAHVIDMHQSVSIGIVIDISVSEDSDWVNYMSLVLAACEEAHDCGLQYQNNQWVLWMYYEDQQSDDELNQYILFQQALAAFLEKDKAASLLTNTVPMSGRQG